MVDRAEQYFVWEVLGSTPEPSINSTVKTHPSYSNLRFAVVARTMDRVFVLAREKYPEMLFHSIQKRNYIGRESVLIDREVQNG